MKSVGIYIGRFQPLHKVHLDTILYGFQKENPIDHLIIFIGSDQRPETLKMEKERLEFKTDLTEEEQKLLSLAQKEPLKNPYTTNLRKQFIEKSVPPELLSKISIIGIKDSNHPNYLDDYRPDEWELNISNSIQNTILEIFNDNIVNYNIYLFGSAKDVATSNYIDNIVKTVKLNDKPFLIKDLIEPVKTIDDKTIDATTVRQLIRKYNENHESYILDELKHVVPNEVLKLLYLV